MMSGTQAIFQLELWGPETETNIYSWIEKIPLAFSWALENRKIKYNGLIDTGTKEVAPKPLLSISQRTPLHADHPTLHSVLNRFLHLFIYPCPMLATEVIISQLSVPVPTINLSQYLCLSLVKFTRQIIWPVDQLVAFDHSLILSPIKGWEDIRARMHQWKAQVLWSDQPGFDSTFLYLFMHCVSKQFNLHETLP